MFLLVFATNYVYSKYAASKSVPDQIDDLKASQEGNQNNVYNSKNAIYKSRCFDCLLEILSKHLTYNLIVTFT
jgi:hypothetical protein